MPTVILLKEISENHFQQVGTVVFHGRLPVQKTDDYKSTGTALAFDDVKRISEALSQSVVVGKTGDLYWHDDSLKTEEQTSDSEHEEKKEDEKDEETGFDQDYEDDLIERAKRLKKLIDDLGLDDDDDHYPQMAPQSARPCTKAQHNWQMRWNYTDPLTGRPMTLFQCSNCQAKVSVLMGQQPMP